MDFELPSQHGRCRVRVGMRLRYFSILTLTTLSLTNCARINELGSRFFSKGGSAIVKGSITGLTGQGMVLRINGLDFSVTGATVQYAAAVKNGDSYALSVVTQPSLPTQTCSFTSGETGVVKDNTVEFAMSCAVPANYTIGGSITGLSGSGLQLQLNDGEILAATGTSFTFASAITDGGQYNVQVKVQPSSPVQICTPQRNVGIVTGAAVTNISIRCSTVPYSLGGYIGGLSSGTVKVQVNGGQVTTRTADGFFLFPTPLADLTSFAVTVAEQPAAKTCSVSNGAGIVNGSGYYATVIHCATQAYTLSGTLTGLNGGSVTLVTSAGEFKALGANGSFTLSRPIADTANFVVEIFRNPTSPVQTCSIMNGSGTISGANISNIQVNCTGTGYTVGGTNTISGLTTDGLVLRLNGGNDLAVPAGSTSFSFTNAPLADLSAFTVTIAAQPAGKKCSLDATASDTIVSGGISNVAVTCVNAYTIGGTIAGKSGTNMVLRNLVNGVPSDFVLVSTAYTFPDSLVSGDVYNLSVYNHPESPYQNCTFDATGAAQTGTIAGANITPVKFSCTNVNVGFVSPTSSYVETAGSVNIDVALSTPTPRAGSVQVTISPVTASPGLDFSVTTTTLQFAANATSLQIPVTILDDVVTEGNEAFEISLSSPVNLNLGTQSTHTVTIIDNEGGLPIFTSLALGTANADGYVNLAERGAAGTLAASLVGSNYTQARYKLVSAATSCDGNLTYGGAGVVPVGTSADFGADGSYRVCVRLEDASSNYAYGSSPTFVLDATVPAFTSMALANAAVGGYINAAETALTTDLAALPVAAGYDTLAYGLTTGTCNAGVTYGAAGVIPKASDMSALSDSTTYKVCVKVSDNAGNPTVYGASATFTLDKTAPTVQSITSATGDGAYITGQSVALTVTFSEPVTLAGGNLDIGLNSGASVSITAMAGVTSASPSPAYTVAAGQAATPLKVNSPLALSAGTLTDAAGNNAVLTVSAGANLNGRSINIDAQPPAIISAQSFDADGNGRIDHYKIIFDQSIMDSSFPGYALNAAGTATTQWLVAGYSNVRLLHGTAVAAGIPGQTDTANDAVIYVKFDEVSSGYDTGATPNLTTTATPGVTDTPGNVMAQVTTTTVTESDGAPPRINTVSGTVGSSAVDVIFTEAVYRSTGATACGSGGELIVASILYTNVSASGMASVSSLSDSCATDSSYKITFQANTTAIAGDLNTDTVGFTGLYDAANNALPAATKVVTGASTQKILVIKSGDSTGEGGAKVLMSVVLPSAPNGDVVINVASSNTAEIAVSPTTLTFTTGNWNTPQIVTATGVADNAPDGNQQVSIGFTVNTGSTTDTSGYATVTIPSQTLSNFDNAVKIKALTRDGTAADQKRCAALTNGLLKCWGRNQYGDLGYGDLVARGDNPGEMADALPYVNLGTARSVVAISGGAGNTCAILDTGGLKCWGRNYAGALGLGDTASRGGAAGDMGDNLPYVSLGTGRTPTAIATGEAYSCAMLDNATLKCWGYAAFGNLGYQNKQNLGDGSGEMGDNLAAIALGTGRTAKAISLASYTTCAILDNDTVKCWGSNNWGTCGQGTASDIGDQNGEMGDSLLAINLGTGRTAKKLAAAQGSVCAILDNNQVKCWGYDALGYGDSSARGDAGGEMGDALPYVDLGTGRTAVDIGGNSALAGTTSFCALLDNGTVKCWGANSYGQLGLGDTNARGNAAGQMGDALPAVDLGTSKTIVGVYQSCALFSDGTAKCWGRNGSGQLGLGDTNHRGDVTGEMGTNLPWLDLGTGRTPIQGAAGASHTCTLFDDGRVKCWGLNTSGQLGLGDVAARGDALGEMSNTLPFVSLGTGRSAVSVKAGENFTCALLDNNSVKCWGLNSNGQLGQGDANPRGSAGGQMGDSLPAIALGTGRKAAAIATGDQHACAVLENGAVKCWGRNNKGQLGYENLNDLGDAGGEMGDALPEVNLGTGRKAMAISAGMEHTCALLDNATVKCWGRGGEGQLGQGNSTNLGGTSNTMGDNLLAINLGTGRTVQAINSARNFNCAILDDSSLKCWGYNDRGQLGLGDATARGTSAGQMGDSLPAVALGTGRTPVSVALGNKHVCAVLNNKTLKCWGEGGNGAIGSGGTAGLGDGANEMGDNLAAVNMGIFPEVVGVFAGQTHSCAILSNSMLKCWGDNASGQLGIGDTTARGNAANQMGDKLLEVWLGY